MPIAVKATLMAAACLTLSLAYVFGYEALRRRQARMLCLRAPSADWEAFARADDELAQQAQQIVLNAISETVGAPADRIRPEDDLAQDLAPPYGWFFLDETDEEVFQRVNRALKAAGLPKWRPRREVRLVSDVVADVAAHLRQNRSSSLIGMAVR